MTEKLYDIDAYCREFQAEVISCTENQAGWEVVLDRTAFYPEGGGQPYDTGSLGSAAVLAVHETDGVIRHLTDRPLEPGCKLTGEIDWERRFSHMQNHTGEHLVSGIIHQKYGFDNVGFHMGKDVVTVDFNGVLTDADLTLVEAAANQMLYQNLPVAASHPDPQTLEKLSYRSKKKLEGDVRIIEIPGGDCCACCGTHVARLGEIGVIKLTGIAPYKGGVRISMLCGSEALKDYQWKQDAVKAISRTLSAKPNEVMEAVTRLKKECEQKDFQIMSLFKELFRYKADAWPDHTDHILMLEEELSPVQLRHFATALLRKSDRVMVCSGNDTDGYKYVAASRTADMRSYGKAMNQVLNGKGGGSQEMIQGTLFCSWEQIRHYFEEEGGRE